MKKVLAILLALIMVFSLAACTDGNNGDVEDNPNTEQPKKIALLVAPLGQSAFVDDAAKGFETAAKANGLDYSIVECSDDAAYEENARALANEDYDLIVGLSWQAGTAMNAIATDYPDNASYALIDSTVEAANVKCISYYEQEGAYLIGMIAALSVDGESHNYGAVHATQSAASWKWRYAYMQGVLSIDPEAKFVFNFVNSYSDPATAKELALQQYELGCKFVNAACAGGDYGVFEAAAEKGFYTAGQDVDLTNPENPYIVSSQIKDTYATAVYVVNMFAAGEWNTENETLGVPEGGIGAVYATHDSKNPRSDRLSDEDIALIKQAVEDIKSGTINLRNMPAEEGYEYPTII